MRKLTPADVLPTDAYLRVRQERLRAIIALKARRRVEVGGTLSLTFENRDTALHQVHEMCRVERITAPEKVAEEVAVYNTLIPDSGELSATLFVEIPDRDAIKPTLDRLIGLDRPGVLTFHVGDAHTLDAIWEEGHSEEGRIAAVQFVRFRFPEAARRAFLDGTRGALRVDHPAYRAFAVIPDEVAAELRGDLGGEAAD